MAPYAPNLMSSSGVNGEIRDPQWPEPTENLLQMSQHQQQPTVMEFIVVSPSSSATSGSSDTSGSSISGSSTSGSSVSQIQMPMGQLSHQDHYVSGYPQFHHQLANNYNEPACGQVAAASNVNITWRPLTAPASNCSCSLTPNSKSDKPNGVRKPKRTRTAFTDSQLIGLEDAFIKNNYYVFGTKRDQLAQNLKLTSKNVKIWFQNRRIKMKAAQKSASENSAPSRVSSAQNIFNMPLTLTPPQEQTTCCVNVAASANFTTQPSNSWIASPMTSASKQCISQPEIHLYPTPEDHIMRVEPAQASPLNEVDSQAVDTDATATWTEDEWKDLANYAANFAASLGPESTLQFL